ncbi:MAG: TVP38/TMEM64 family protein [Cyanobacteria bacterium CRU_2_1]|nr:TVP38/TMEM64 family protein [Cyanobacteria bacterium CRU_2_1]
MSRSRRRKANLKALFTLQNAVALAVILVSLLVFWQVRQAEINLFTAEGLKQVVDRSGFWGPLVYIAILALSVVLSHIPELPLAMAAGAVWGAIPAGIYSVIGGFLGSLMAYFLGRSLGRSAIKALTGKTIYFSKDRGEIYLGWIIFISRLLPVFSFDLISYASGISGLSLRIYVAATFFGMLLPTFALTYAGESFKLGIDSTIAFATIFLIVFIGLPWGIRRYNWFGMKDIIRVE